jgi:HEAT repeat protein
MPAQFRPDEYLEHEDARVRREAYKLLFAHTDWRADAILKAAGDPDTGIVRLALSAALENCPDDLNPRLLEHLNGRYRDHDIRMLAIRLIGRRPSDGGREWLIRRVASQRGWGPFRRFRLEPKSAEVLGAVVVLHQTYGDHEDAAAVLRMAESSSDPDFRAAARGVMPRTT